MSAIVVLPNEGKSVRLGGSGVGVVFKLYSADTGGLFALVEHPIDPGALVPPHLHHDEDEYSYVLEGEITLEVGDELIHAPAGTLVSKPRGIWHSFWNATEKPARILEIIAPAGLEKFFEEAAALGSPDTERRMALMSKYNIEFGDWSRITELEQKYNLTFRGLPRPRNR
jgi:quercetin dioxygenase-like cupin family protein